MELVPYGQLNGENPIFPLPFWCVSIIILMILIILLPRETPHYDMRLVDVTDLHNRIKDNYHAWVAQAPNDWKTDGFLENNIPILIPMNIYIYI